MNVLMYITIQTTSVMRVEHDADAGAAAATTKDDDEADGDDDQNDRNTSQSIGNRVQSMKVFFI